MRAAGEHSQVGDEAEVIHGNSMRQLDVAYQKSGCPGDELLVAEAECKSIENSQPAPTACFVFEARLPQEIDVAVDGTRQEGCGNGNGCC